jgi:hypothetical protein
MSDTSLNASSFRHHFRWGALVVCGALLAGIALRCSATTGELWLDEMWSLLKVSQLTNPVEILTTVKHDNNHIFNSLWMWVCGPGQGAILYRLPSLIFSLILLVLLIPRGRNEITGRWSAIWLTLVAFSYPLTLYGTEARGYSLTLLCAATAFLSLNRLTTNAFDRGAIALFSVAGILGVISHAIYALFLAPAVAWLLWNMMRSSLRTNSRAILLGGIVPPVLVACALTLTFYRGMEIGGGPRLPYLEVAASAISVSFGGESLSSINHAVTGWSVFLCVAMSLMCIAEVLVWMRAGSPLATLVALILLTPWIAVGLVQPNFIFERYFIIQILFAYLVAARFLARLFRQGLIGSIVATVILVAFIFANTRHTLTLINVGRSNFVRIFQGFAAQGDAREITVGGNQDFRNSMRLAYTRMVAPQTSGITYIPNYRNATVPPHYILRESLEAYEIFPENMTGPQGAEYRASQRYSAPLLNGSHVTVYEMVR